MIERTVKACLGAIALALCGLGVTETTVLNASTWQRDDWACPDPTKEKTRCSTGGIEQCTATYCS